VVPHGHNVLWEAPEQTIAAILGFLAAQEEGAIATAVSSRPSSSAQRP
jgi:hypothetical protein